MLYWFIIFFFSLDEHFSLKFSTYRRILLPGIQGKFNLRCFIYINIIKILLLLLLLLYIYIIIFFFNNTQQFCAKLETKIQFFKAWFYLLMCRAMASFLNSVCSYHLWWQIIQPQSTVQSLCWMKNRSKLV